MESEYPHRKTRQRDAVFMTLQRFRARRVHPTTDEVYVDVRRTLPRISLATVYRNLDVLAAQGIIQKLGLGCSPVRFDGDPSDHVHIRCLQCGRVDDLHGVRVTASQAEVDSFHGYEVAGLHAEYVGICGVCKAMHRKPPRPQDGDHTSTTDGGNHGSDQGNQN